MTVHHVELEERAILELFAFAFAFAFPSDHPTEAGKELNDIEAQQYQ